jgi:hypothetical protein
MIFITAYKCFFIQDEWRSKYWSRRGEEEIWGVCIFVLEGGKIERLKSEKGRDK